MEFVLIQLEQKHDEYEQCIDHEKREHGFVPQLDQIGRNASLFVLVLVDWVQVFVDQVPPELLFRYGQECHRTLSQRFVFDPEGIDVVVPFYSGFCTSKNARYSREIQKKDTQQITERSDYILFITTNAYPKTRHRTPRRNAHFRSSLPGPGPVRSDGVHYWSKRSSYDSPPSDPL